MTTRKELEAQRKALRKVDRHDFEHVTAQRDAARAEVARLRDWIDTEGRNCPSHTTVDAALKPGADSPRWCQICGQWGDHHTDRHDSGR